MAPAGPRMSLLTEGAHVRAVALSSPIPDDRLDAGLDVVRSWGLQVSEAPGLRARHPRLDYLAGRDEDRAADFMAAWLDPQVDAIWCGRGGYGALRVLDLLDWEQLGSVAPTPVIGFSDVTALLCALWSRLGVSGVHGPVLTSLGDGDAATADHLHRLLLGSGALRIEGEPIVDGTAQGPLLGGNLALLASLLGSTDLPSADGAIVLLEDIAEQPRRIDRMLTSLLRAGWFDGVAAVGLGSFTDCGDRDQVLGVCVDRLSPLGIPLVGRMPFGHDAVNLAFPVGAVARLSGGSLDFRSGTAQP